MKRLVAVLFVVAANASCAFEVCCMRPATGLYDACIAAAAPPPVVEERRATEVAAPAHAPAALAR